MRLEAHGTFHFYVAGDFWSKSIADEQVIFKWCLIDLAIPMQDFDNNRRDENNKIVGEVKRSNDDKLQMLRNKL